MKRINYSVLAFTLAETLITLVIIGVIAAITVPTLITKYQKEQTVTRLKKVYSSFAQTTVRAVADNGPIKTWEKGNSARFANNYLIPYLSISKNCGTNNSGPCNFNKFYLNDEPDNTMVDKPKFILNDGTLVGISYNKSDIAQKVKILVDINGPKKPNKNGKDVFGFFYYLQDDETPDIVGKFVPDGGWRSFDELLNDSDDYACKKGKKGTHCMALIMKQGWQITDDYPW